MISLYKFRKLVDHFNETDELGDYNEHNYSITLYDIKNTDKTLADINERIKAMSIKCKLIVLHPEREYTNIKILDIEL